MLRVQVVEVGAEIVLKAGETKVDNIAGHWRVPSKQSTRVGQHFFDDEVGGVHDSLPPLSRCWAMSSSACIISLALGELTRRVAHSVQSQPPSARRTPAPPQSAHLRSVALMAHSAD